jgi:tetratricopeptide (TPR) repeat protein
MTKDELFALAMVKVKENDHNEAIKLFTEVLAIDTKDANAYSQRGIAYLNIERFDLSLLDMNAAVALDNEYSFRYASRAYLKSRIGDLEGAVADYEKATQLDPSDGINFNNLALAQEQLGYAMKAKSNFEKSDDLTGVTATRAARLKREEKANQQKEPEKIDGKTVAKSVFLSKKGFKEFLQFIKNGFKLKDNDKK